MPADMVDAEGAGARLRECALARTASGARRDATPHADGSATFHDVEVFTGTVNGVPGTVTLNLAGSNDSALTVEVTSTIVSATGALSGLHGTLNLAGSVRIPQGPYGTYSGKIG